LKFVDGNLTAIRNVVVDNCIITGSNRGIAFMVFNKGYVSDVLISNVTIETTAFDWFWWGEADPIHFNIKRLSEIDTRRSKAQDPPIGAIRHVVLRNIIARGKGTSSIHGHPERPLEDVTLDNVKIFMSADPQWPLQKAVEAMSVRWAKDLRLKDVEVVWDKPDSEKWQHALHLQDIKDLELIGFRGGSVKTGTPSPVVVLEEVQDAMIKNAKLRQGTEVFIDLRGEQSRNIVLTDNDLRNARIPYQVNKSARSSELKASDNLIAGSQTSARSAKPNR
jgi:hypothetical protein